MPKPKISLAMRNRIFKRDGYRCLWCGKGNADGVTLHADHVLPEAFGGSTMDENLGTLCGTCNTSKGSEYFGSYLLATLFKLKNLESHFKEEDYGKNFRVSLSFYIEREEIEEFLPHKISSVGSLPESFMPLQGDTLTIRKSEVKRDTRLALKEKIKNFLFENQGFIEELDGKLIFRKRVSSRTI